MAPSQSPFPSPGPPAPPSTRKRVSYFYEPEIGAFYYTYQHPMKPHRMRVAHSLICAYGLLNHMEVVRPRRATAVDMTRFHTDEYIDFLSRVTPANLKARTEEHRFMTGEDSPPFDGLYEFATVTAGASMSAAHSLVTGHSDIAINWAGGLHHAKRAEASGFCYVNDIVLGILELLRVHARVLYIDIDIHHGDGVEEAFYTTDRVMTCSFHKYRDFFPGTGSHTDNGKGKGKGYAINFPLSDGIGDDSFCAAFRSVIGAIMAWYRPGAVVLQCGADSLAGDKLGVFNLSMNAHSACVAYMRTFDVPLMLLGGGGYTVKNVARTWCYETAVAIGIADTIDLNLPSNEYLEWFGPRYKLEVLNNNMEDMNTAEYMEEIKTHIFECMRGMPFAPGVQMHETPRRPFGWAEDEWESEDSDDQEMDIRISQRLRDAHTRASDPLSDSESEPDSDDGPHAHERTFRARKAPRKRKHYHDRLTPPPTSGVNGKAAAEEVVHRPMKRKRVFFEMPKVETDFGSVFGRGSSRSFSAVAPPQEEEDAEDAEDEEQDAEEEEEKEEAEDAEDEEGEVDAEEGEDEEELEELEEDGEDVDVDVDVEDENGDDMEGFDVDEPEPEADEMDDVEENEPDADADEGESEGDDLDEPDAAPAAPAEPDAEPDVELEEGEIEEGEINEGAVAEEEEEEEEVRGRVREPKDLRAEPDGGHEVGEAFDPLRAIAAVYSS